MSYSRNVRPHSRRIDKFPVHYIFLMSTNKNSMPNKWIEHLLKVWKIEKPKGRSYRATMTLAKKSYRKGKGPKSSPAPTPAPAPKKKRRRRQKKKAQ